MVRTSYYSPRPLLGAPLFGLGSAVGLLDLARSFDLALEPLRPALLSFPFVLTVASSVLRPGQMAALPGPSTRPGIPVIFALLFLIIVLNSPFPLIIEPINLGLLEFVVLLGRAPRPPSLVVILMRLLPLRPASLMSFVLLPY